MSTRSLDKNGDWNFGQGKANYLNRIKEVEQNVVTRIKSFKNDWFLDLDAEIDWFNILGNKNNETIIKNEITRVTIETDGVRGVSYLELVEIKNRKAFIRIAVETIFDRTFQTEIGILS